ncbi:MAG: hypothetical protein JXA30_13575 [Deltaproteobacteria bacterium]|nr:hypothetical protein [Deltaproteobacteria bacterium]
MIDDYDERRTYCRMLGHYLSFAYCRSLKQGLPCHKVLDCWFEHFPVEDFIREHYSDAQRELFLAPPKDKMTSLFELIERAKKHST